VSTSRASVQRNQNPINCKLPHFIRLNFAVIVDLSILNPSIICSPHLTHWRFDEASSSHFRCLLSCMDSIIFNIVLPLSLIFICSGRVENLDVHIPYHGYYLFPILWTSQSVFDQRSRSSPSIFPPLPHKSSSARVKSSQRETSKTSSRHFSCLLNFSDPLKAIAIIGKNRSFLFDFLPNTNKHFVFTELTQLFPDPSRTCSIEQHKQDVLGQCWQWWRWLGR